jgi:formylglycine-generating enzyme required for sulfatase activity
MAARRAAPRRMRSAPLWIGGTLFLLAAVTGAYVAMHRVSSPSTEAREEPSPPAAAVVREETAVEAPAAPVEQGGPETETREEEAPAVDPAPPPAVAEEAEPAPPEKTEPEPVVGASEEKPADGAEAAAEPAPAETPAAPAAEARAEAAAPEVVVAPPAPAPPAAAPPPSAPAPAPAEPPPAVRSPVVTVIPEPPPPRIPGYRYLERNREGRHEYRHEATGMVMVLIPGATFAMGSTAAERDQVAALIDRRVGDGRSRALLRDMLRSEGPQHEVRLDPFLIAKHEVRQDVWTRVMGRNPSRFQGDALPVEGVSWLEAKEFCRRSGLLLPSEAQWECACRGGMQGAFATGETITTDQANFNGDYAFAGERGVRRGRTVPAGALPANPFGLQEVHGNVAEWCEDAFDEAFYGTPPASRANPVALPRTDAAPRVLRGGSWAAFSWSLRSAARDSGMPDRPHHLRGLRPAYAPVP